MIQISLIESSFKLEKTIFPRANSAAQIKCPITICAPPQGSLIKKEVSRRQRVELTNRTGKVIVHASIRCQHDTCRNNLPIFFCPKYLGILRKIFKDRFIELFSKIVVLFCIILIHSSVINHTKLLINLRKTAVINLNIILDSLTNHISVFTDYVIPYILWG